MAYVEVLASFHGEGTWMNAPTRWRLRHPGRVIDLDAGQVAAQDWDRVEDRAAVHMINNLEYLRLARAEGWPC